MTRYTKLEKKKYEKAAGFENLSKKSDKKKIEKSAKIISLHFEVLIY